MSHSDREKRHSPSALLTALYRAVAHKEFADRKAGPDYLAEIFLPSHVRFLIRFAAMRARGRAKERRKTPGVYEYMAARTVCFDAAFTDALNENIPQIVILGAGYDTRACRFADYNQGTRIIELDNGSTQERKQSRLREFGIETPAQVIYAPIDFNEEPLQGVLARAGYEDDKKTLFLWEGVSMYLESGSVDAILALVARSSHRESAVLFDYAVSLSDHNSRCYGAQELIRALKRKDRSIEPFTFTIDEEGMISLLAGRGLKMVRHWDQRQMEQCLAKTAGMSVGQPNGLFRIAMASHG